MLLSNAILNRLRLRHYGSGGDTTLCGADFSECRTWRYALYRVWDEQRDPLVVIGLNPSTADEFADDPTIRRCRGFAQRWGHGGLVMLNLFAARTPTPAVMFQRHRAGQDIVGPANDNTIERLCERRRVLCAWGAHGRRFDRDLQATALAEGAGAQLLCLRYTNQRDPWHPLYVPADTEPIHFTVRA